MLPLAAIAPNKLMFVRLCEAESTPWSIVWRGQLFRLVRPSRLDQGGASNLNAGDVFTISGVYAVDPDSKDSLGSGSA
jgi:hypothetical protein